MKMAGKSIKQLKDEIATLQRKNRDLEEKKKLEETLSRLKAKTKKPGKIERAGQHVRKVKKDVRSFLGPVGDSLDRAFG